ncbi:hypothetical protein FZI85_23615 [Mycobacterium sp. CBMA293]|uniref:hypothetical protein n=1 Tax=unclassified Mycolicibacterium TaxID=2636767 RepID=UPI0012DDE27B|nr:MULTISPECIES: hypothetical protein [unclassified Mycolicibacterium]MUL45749.1 hypothetical protein [Mycolicibacterium sp. CBMA 360]MUL60420.1 hypothetical protein [Mycolicibacterium sp. CBMA 335]MUL72235.1 hypothetical protein [Mycolicibacterium sp. CBMA 311]MUL95364.1 hypothetical protein [Mycolicibacterium sp. CBMA 230]MUM06815.1 hypothetical protein [Mycolicibacterium sp. CBMA 213]
MGNTLRTVAATAAVIGLIAGCSKASDSGAKESSSPAPSTAASAAVNPAQLQALVPTPASTAQTFGPNNIADNGIHLAFKVTGGPTDVVTAYKAALEGKGWTVTTIVSSTGGPGGGGGATYTGTHGDNYGVFDGGGYGTETWLNVCTWPTKPAQPNCSRNR